MGRGQTSLFAAARNGKKKITIMLECLSEIQCLLKVGMGE